MRNAAETFGFERELMGRWENWTTRGGAGGPVRLVKGQIVIVDDAVDYDAPGRREPLRTTGFTVASTGDLRGVCSSSRSP